jgi:hypothetical protein
MTEVTAQVTTTSTECEIVKHCLLRMKHSQNPLTLWGPEDCGRLRRPYSMTAALEGSRLSALRTGRLYPQEYPGTHFKSLSRPRAHGIVGCHGKKSPVTPPGIDPGTFRLA